MVRKLVEQEQIRPSKLGRRVLFDPEDLWGFVDSLRDDRDETPVSAAA
jgi:hypothetical protein